MRCAEKRELEEKIPRKKRGKMVPADRKEQEQVNR